jgi:internalin A
MKEKNNQKIATAINNVKLHGWQVVDLRNCGLEEFPSELFNYPNIVSIDLGNDDFVEINRRNSIKEIPAEIEKIKRLSILNLENNEIEKVSERISQLRDLTRLNLQGNNLKELSEKIANMSGLKELVLYDNPFDMLPPEIVARGIDSIRNFFKELKEQDFIYEVKLIIVGEGRVGKTCLSRALVQDDFTLSDEESTEGINIDTWIIPQNEIKKINPKIERDFQINIWDFGGQEIYHSTHQFFLTKRSIYLLVTESRKEDSHDDFFYWLNIIKLLGDKSPVMMVLNKCDQPTKELPVKEYQSAFNNIIGFDKISLKEEFRESFNEFKMALKKIASELPHIGAPLPKVWVDIRKELEELKVKGKDYISRTEYLDICRKYYRKEESALSLSEYFHDLGVIIHFEDDVDLRDIVVLNHEWITKGVYKILDDQEVIKKKGRFNNADILRIWSNEEHKEKIRELLSLMKNNKFDLCFELDNGEYLVPRLLPVDEVDHDWVPSGYNSKFEFRYNFMPKGILARLIVKLNSDIYKDKYWRYGVILESEGTFAIIKEKYFENKITIELSGPNKREFLFLIRKTINEIHRDFNKLAVTEMVPCNCQSCSSSLDPHFYDFDLLRRYESKDISKIRCDISLQEVPVFDLTSDIARRAFSQEKIIFCENKNAELLNQLGFAKTSFFPERDSSSVFIKVNTKPDYFGLRDRDFLLDSEIERIQGKYENYFILEYYCFENYLYHPENLEELKLVGFSKVKYVDDIISQKNAVKNSIISNYKNDRKSYQEFKIESDKLCDKKNEEEIIQYLESDDIEVFFKAYSMKDKFKKDSLAKYALKEKDLISTEWFKSKMTNLFSIN